LLNKKQNVIVISYWPSAERLFLFQLTFAARSLTPEAFGGKERRVRKGREAEAKADRVQERDNQERRFGH